MRKATATRLLVLLLASLLVACGGSSTHFAVQRSPSPTFHLSGPPPRIAVIVMENEEYGEIVGSPSTPFINGLAKRYALATEMYAITHPSLPNYLALTSGSTHGIDSDCTDCAIPGAGLVGQFAQHHISWKAYMEDLPHPCFTGAGHAAYAKKHDPFVYYRAVAGNPTLCGQIVPFNRLAGDEAAARLPTFVWITPNLCHDMHDCDPSVGDRFLARIVPPLLKGLGPRGLLVLTWDEGSSDNGCCRLASGGHVATILAGPLAASGVRLRTPADHYSVLQAIEDMLRLPRLAGASCACTPTLGPLLRGLPPS